MSGVRPKRLIKKYRLDEVRSYAWNVTIGMYVDPATSLFYALVPEEEHGREISAKSLAELKPLIEPAITAYYDLKWTDVIRLSYRHYDKWDPNDPTTASDSVGPLSFSRVSIALHPDGVHRMVRSKHETSRYIGGGYGRVKAGDPREETERIGSEPVKANYPSHQHEIPYSDEAWAALEAFQAKIRSLDHAIRKFFERQDFMAVLLAGSMPLALEDKSMRSDVIDVQPEPVLPPVPPKPRPRKV